MKNNKKKLFIAGIVFLITVGISIGYAYLSNTLNITGASDITKNTWDIHFENIIVKEGSITPTTQAAIKNNSTQVDFSVNLKVPGEFYEFTVDVVNAGSIDAMVSGVLVGGITSEQAAYTEYKVTYANGAPISEKGLLSAGKKATIKFMIKFKDDVISSQLPMEDQTLNLAFKVTYIQADIKEIEAFSLKSWTEASADDFHNSTYKESIVKASFVDYIDLTNAVTLTNGTGSNYWDLSADQNGSILGWLELDSEDSTKYNLYIGTSGTTLYANKDASYLFYKFTNLKEAQFQNFNTSKITNMNSMFWRCGSLTSLDVGNFNTSNTTTMYAMFYNCSSLTSLDINKFNTSNVIDMQYMFYNCSNLTSLDINKFNTSNVIDMQYMFYKCSSLTSLDVSNFDTRNVTSMSYMFYYCSSLTNLDVSNFGTSSVKDISGMFNYCLGLTSLDVSSFDTSKVTKMQFIFYKCSSLTSLDVSNFNTRNVIDLQFAFYNCSSLTSLDLSNFNTSNVTNMSSMFSHCTSLTNLDVSNFNTNKVTTMYAIFYECSSLTSLNLSNFDTSNVINMDYMFYNCSSLTTLDLSSFDMSKVENKSSMLSNTSKVTTAYARTAADAAILNSGTDKPSTYTFVVKA